MTYEEKYRENPYRWTVYWLNIPTSLWHKMNKDLSKWDGWDSAILVYKKDEIIADAAIANPNVEIQFKVKDVPDEYTNSTIKGNDFLKHYSTNYDYQIKGTTQLVNSTIDLYDLPISSKHITLIEILQDVQNKQMSVHASELLIKALFTVTKL